MVSSVLKRWPCSPKPLVTISSVVKWSCKISLSVTCALAEPVNAKATNTDKERTFALPLFIILISS